MKRFQLASISLALLAAGCGGGGGGTPAASIPTAAIQINSTNAPTVASGANNSSSTMTGVSQNTAIPTTVVTQTQKSTLNVINSAMNQIASVKSMSLQPGTVVGAATPLTCDSGSGTIDFVDADASGSFTNGDSVVVVYNNCTQAGATMNGTASITVNVDSFTVAYTGFSETSAGNTLSMQGDLTFSTGTVGSGLYAGYTYFRVSGTSLETNSTADGHFKMWAPNGGSGYDVSFAFSGTSYAYSIDMSVASFEMDGSVSITTPTEFAGDSAVAPGNPTTGQMIVEGASGSKLRMTAQANGTDVMLEVDEAGDGTYEWTQTTTWAAL